MGRGDKLGCSIAFNVCASFSRALAVISDAGQGGQVLVCAATFSAVKGLAMELGSVTHEGTVVGRSAEKRPWPFPSWIRWDYGGQRGAIWEPCSDGEPPSAGFNLSCLPLALIQHCM